MCNDPLLIAENSNELPKHKTNHQNKKSNIIGIIWRNTMFKE